MNEVLHWAMRFSVLQLYCEKRMSGMVTHARHAENSTNLSSPSDMVPWSSLCQVISHSDRNVQRDADQEWRCLHVSTSQLVLVEQQGNTWTNWGTQDIHPSVLHVYLNSSTRQKFRRWKLGEMKITWTKGFMQVSVYVDSATWRKGQRQHIYFPPTNSWQ